MATTESHAIARGVVEFSKRMITGVLAMFAVQVVLSLLILWLHRERRERIELMRVCIPFYVTGLAGYSAKAGVENALKITTEAKQFSVDGSKKENG